MIQFGNACGGRRSASGARGRSRGEARDRDPRPGPQRAAGAAFWIFGFVATHSHLLIQCKNRVVTETVQKQRLIFILHSFRSARRCRGKPDVSLLESDFARRVSAPKRFRGRLLLIWSRAGTEAWFAPAAVMCEQERGTQSAVSQARVVDLVPVAPLDGAFSIVVETVSVLDERLAHLCRRARLAERQLERGVGGLHVGRVHKRVRDRC